MACLRALVAFTPPQVLLCPPDHLLLSTVMPEVASRSNDSSPHLRLFSLQSTQVCLSRIMSALPAPPKAAYGRDHSKHIISSIFHTTEAAGDEWQTPLHKPLEGLPA